MKRFFKWLAYGLLGLVGLFAVAIVFTIFSPPPVLGEITVGTKSIKVFGKAETTRQSVEGRNVLMVFDKTEIKLQNDVFTVNGKTIPLPSFEKLEIYIKAGAEPEIRVVPQSTPKK